MSNKFTYNDVQAIVLVSKYPEVRDLTIDTQGNMVTTTTDLFIREDGTEEVRVVSIEIAGGGKDKG